MSYNIEIIKTNLTLGEAPHWVAEEKSLYLTDISAGRILKIDTSQNNKITSIVPRENYPVSFIIPVHEKPGQFVIGSRKEILLIYWNGLDQSSNDCEFEILSILNGDAGNTLNDGKADAYGRIWTGTLGQQVNGVFEDHQAKLFMFDGNKLNEQLDKIGISNGLAWSLDNKTMYYIDSLRSRVDAMDYDVKKGQIANRRVIFDLKKNNIEGMPDGMTIDNEGMLWVALFNGAQILRIDPNQSKVIDKIQLPAYNITSATFGGDNYDELYITSAYLKMTPEQMKLYPESGNVFRITGLGGIHGQNNINAKI